MSEEYTSRIVAYVLLAAVFILTLSTIGLAGVGIPLSSLVLTGPVLQVQVTPNAIPLSGSWDASAYLFFQNNSSRLNVNSTVTMIATMSDRSKTVETQQTVDGHTIFQAPLGTVGVRFEATFESYHGSKTIHGPTVIPEVYAWGIGSGGLTAGAGTLIGLPKWATHTITNKNLRRLFLAAFPFGGLFLPLYYFVVEESPWFGSGWAPSSSLGVPIYLIAIIPVMLVAIRFLWSSNSPDSRSRKRSIGSKESLTKRHHRKGDLLHRV